MQTLKFSGLEWEVKDGRSMGPGPNAWSADHVWLNKRGGLHMKLAPRGGVWHCAEVGTLRPLGFGTYRFAIEGPLRRLDPNIVFGLFNYPTPEIGPDTTHEIDIEIARWGIPDAPPGNFTVWPARVGRKQNFQTFPFAPRGDRWDGEFIWRRDSVRFRCTSEGKELAAWEFRPKSPELDIPQRPLPLRMNLWLHGGRLPADRRPVEVIIHHVTFLPER